MAVYSASTWRITLDGMNLNNAVDYLVNSLQNYSYRVAVQDFTLNEDRDQVFNWLSGWTAASKTMTKENRKHGPVMIRGNLGSSDRKLVLGKMTARESSEVILCTLFDAGCDYS